MVEVVDTRDLKSLDRMVMRVQVPPQVPYRKNEEIMDLKNPEVKSFFMSIMLYGLKVPQLKQEDLPKIVQEFADWWVATSSTTSAFVLKETDVMIVNKDLQSLNPVCIIGFEGEEIQFTYDKENFDEQYFIFSVIDTVKYFYEKFCPGHGIEPVKSIDPLPEGSSSIFENNDFIMP